MTNEEYLANEAFLHRKMVVRAEKQSLQDRKDAEDNYLAHLQDPDRMARSIDDIHAGNYGIWPMTLADRDRDNKRCNYKARVSQLVALLDHNCPQRHAVKAWKRYQDLS